MMSLFALLSPHSLVILSPRLTLSLSLHLPTRWMLHP